VFDYIKLLRPQQWIKNFFLFAGLIFSLQFYHTESILITIYAFFIFCILSSSVHILNDIIDYEEDRIHPIKSRRLISAGKISRTSAGIIAIILALGALILAFFIINNYYFYTCLLYLIMMVVYSLKIKHIIILDILFVAIGYVLRAIAGAVAIRVEISSWLLLCTFLLALFIVVSKRRTEIIALGHEAPKHRKILSQYSIDLLNQMIAIVTSACIVSYCLYTLAPETIAKFHTRNLILTTPFVIYGLFRYLYITYKKLEADIPEKALLSDTPLQICLIAWIVVCLLILTKNNYLLY
jgi:4-hydroxybenzoate polyprenyltransferase